MVGNIGKEILKYFIEIIAYDRQNFKKTVISSLKYPKSKITFAFRCLLPTSIIKYTVCYMLYIYEYAIKSHVKAITFHWPWLRYCNVLATQLFAIKENFSVSYESTFYKIIFFYTIDMNSFIFIWRKISDLFVCFFFIFIIILAYSTDYKHLSIQICMCIWHTNDLTCNVIFKPLFDDHYYYCIILLHSIGFTIILKIK